MTYEETLYYNNLQADPTLNPYVFEKLFKYINTHIVPRPGVAMRLVEGVPMVYNSFVENDVFGIMFPAELDPPVFGSNSSFNNINSFIDVSSFANSPFGQYWEKNLPEWAVEEFGPATSADAYNVYIADVTHTVSQAQVEDYAKFSNYKPRAYQYHIFVCIDGEAVIKKYNDPNVLPKENEVYIFMELHDGKFNFGKIVRIKLGKNVVKDMEFRFLGESLGENELATRIIKSINLLDKKNKIVKDVKNTRDFNNLLYSAISHEYNNREFDDVPLLFMVFDAEFIAFETMKFLQGISSDLRGLKYTEEKYWNANLAKGYDPAFLPTGFFTMNGEQQIKELKEIILKPATIIDLVIGKNFPDKHPMQEFVVSKLSGMKKDLEAILKPYGLEFINMVEAAEAGQDISTLFKYLNAYYVGLYNGIIELVAGFFDFLSLIVMMIRGEIGFKMTDALFEKIENIFNFLYEDTSSLIILIFEKLRELGEFFSNIRYYSYNIVEEIGELTPDILTFFLAWLKTGKLARVGAASAVGDEVAAKEMAERLTTGNIDELREQSAKQSAEVLDNKFDDLVKRELNLPASFKVGKYNPLRSFDVNNCGGSIADFTWNDAKILKEGISDIKTHISRLDEIPANTKMIDRLERIFRGELEITDWDKRFYTHELREYERYKQAGIPDNVDPGYDFWNNAHTATLEDYKVSEYVNGHGMLYHPEIKPEDFH